MVCTNTVDYLCMYLSIYPCSNVCMYSIFESCRQYLGYPSQAIPTTLISVTPDKTAQNSDASVLVSGEASLPPAAGGGGHDRISPHPLPPIFPVSPAVDLLNDCSTRRGCWMCGGALWCREECCGCSASFCAGCHTGSTEAFPECGLLMCCVWSGATRGVGMGGSHPHIHGSPVLT